MSWRVKTVLSSPIIRDPILEEMTLAAISDLEVERRLRAWADVTLVSLTLKRAALREQQPETRGPEIEGGVWKERADRESGSDE